MPTVYFYSSWGDDSALRNRLERQTPGCRGVWNDLEIVEEIEDAEYHVALNQPGEDLDERKLILYALEPPFSGLTAEWNEISALSKNPIEECYFPQIWWVEESYDDLKAMGPLEKSRDLSWITSDKGRNENPVLKWVKKRLIDFGFRTHRRKEIPYLDRGASDGHILRMEFLENLVSAHPEMLDLYGRGEFDGPYYHGELEDKWDGLAEYRYSLAIENYRGPNYFSEKLTDALLAWSMPIYWGCTNLDEFLPSDSFVEIDIRDPDAPERIMEIVESDRRERNLDAIAEARELILDRYQLIPTVERTIAEHQ